MSCGLGAVVLVLILLKLQPEEQPVETDTLRADLEQLEEQERALLLELTEKSQEQTALTVQTADMQKTVQKIDQKLAALQQQTSDRRVELEGLKERIEKTPVTKKKDVVDDVQKGEETYLLGLKVEGPRIVFLIDMSASMTDEKLIDIIRRKSGSDSDRKKGPKWQRTKRVARWLASRIPAVSKAVILGFNNKTVPIGPASWFNGSDTGAVERVFTDLDSLVPTEATNLQKALKTAGALSPKPSNYYIVTDGLPTAGTSNYRSLNPFSDCFSLVGAAATISGECRVKLFRQTVSESAPGFRRPVNIILLPLEGDPHAAPEFWSWTYLTGGLLISPAENWP